MKRAIVIKMEYNHPFLGEEGYTELRYAVSYSGNNGNLLLIQDYDYKFHEDTYEGSSTPTMFEQDAVWQ